MYSGAGPRGVGEQEVYEGGLSSIVHGIAL